MTDTVLDLMEECPRQPLSLHQFYTGDFDSDPSGCDIGRITLDMKNTYEIFNKDRIGNTLWLWSLSALVGFLIIGWILTCVLCQCERYG